MLTTRKGFIAVRPPVFEKIEAEIVGGIARVAQRSSLQEVPMLMDGYVGDTLLKTGTIILLRGEAGTTSWAKSVFNLSTGESFALCPENDVIGYRTK